MTRLANALRVRRPDLDQAGMTGGDQMSGDEPFSLSDAISALEELADLAELETALRARVWTMRVRASGGPSDGRQWMTSKP